MGHLAACTPTSLVMTSSWCTATIVHPAAGEGCNGDGVRLWCDLPGFSVYRVLINVKVGEYIELVKTCSQRIYTTWQNPTLEDI